MCATQCVHVRMIQGVRNIAIAGAAWVPRWCVGWPVLARMTNNFDILGQLRHEWRYSAHTFQARRALHGLRSRHPDAGFEELDDLGDVVGALDTGGGRTLLERARIVSAMLEDAGDPDVHRALLQTMIPGIVNVCRQLRFGEGIIDDPSETLGVALALASELMHDWAGQSRAYAAPDLLSALRCRLRRWLLKEKQARRVLGAHDEGERPATSASPLLTRLESLRDTPYERLARLTYARVFEGRSLKEVAADDHSSPVTLQSELRRFAIRFLV